MSNVTFTNNSFYLAAFDASDGEEMPKKSQVIHNNWLGQWGQEYGLKAYDFVKLVFPEGMENTPEGRKQLTNLFTVNRRKLDGTLIESYQVVIAAWGPFVKNGEVYAIRTTKLDVLDKFIEMAQTFENLYRASTFFGPNGTAGIVGDFNILAVPIGTKIHAGSLPTLVVADGQGYTFDDLVAPAEGYEVFRRWNMGDYSEVSFTVLQDLTWNEALAAELLPYMEKNLEILRDDSWFEFIEQRRLKESGESQYSDVALREQVLADLRASGVSEETMARLKENKFFTHSMSDAWARKATAIATSCGIPSQGGVVVGVAGEGNFVVIPGGPLSKFDTMDMAIAWRYPISDPNSKQAVVVVNNGPMADFLLNASGFQYRLATKHFTHSLKGVSVILLREKVGDTITLELPNGQMVQADVANIGMITALDDIKMKGAQVKVNKDNPTPQVVEIKEGLLTLNQWYAVGNLIGVPLGLQGKLGADADGDLIFFANGDTFPEMYRQVANHKNLHFAKLTKTKTSIREKVALVKTEADALRFVGHAASYALDAMTNAVGRVSNMLAGWYAMSPAQQAIVAENRFGKSPDEVVSTVMELLQISVDLFKVNINSADLNKKIQRYGKAYGTASDSADDKLIGKVAAHWTQFKRSDTLFRKDLPNPADWAQFDGTIAQVLNYAFEQDEQGDFVRFPQPPRIIPRPDADYKAWVTQPKGYILEVAATIYQRYGYYAQSLNMSRDADGNNKEWDEFVDTMKARIESYLRGVNKELQAAGEKPFTRQQVAEALWYYIHTTERSSQFKNSNTAPWVLFYEETVNIVADYDQAGPKQAAAISGIINGLKFAFQDPQDRFQLDGQTITVVIKQQPHTRTDGNEQYRYFVTTNGQRLTGQKDPADLTKYPAGCLGLLAHQTVLTEGEHKASFKLIPGKQHGESWQITLVA